MASVLLIVFNRPKTTRLVLEAISQYKPKTLYIAADGPRYKEDEKSCAEVRALVKNISWKCEVKTLFRDKNLGCRTAIVSAINWFFETEESGIILEDDCLPSLSFFSFCNEMLTKYSKESSIMQVNGNCYLEPSLRSKHSYYFSKLNGCWGWATWKRAWKKYDHTMNEYEELKKSYKIAKYFGHKGISDWMISYLDEAIKPSCDIWSTKWSYAIIKNNGLCVNPFSNLVINIGFSDNPTSGFHESFLKYEEYPLEEIIKISHQNNINYDPQPDITTFEQVIKKSDPRLIPKSIGYYKNKIFTLPFRFYRKLKQLI